MKCWTCDAHWLAILISVDALSLVMVAGYVPAGTIPLRREAYRVATAMAEHFPQGAPQFWAADWNGHVGSDMAYDGSRAGSKLLQMPTTAGGRVQRSWLEKAKL